MDPFIDVFYDKVYPLTIYTSTTLIPPSREEYDIMMGTLMDYSELSIRYGFITLFVGSCPIAPMIEYISNVVEIRVDASKLLYDHRRPIPQVSTPL